MDKKKLFEDLEQKLREGTMNRSDFLKATGKIAMASLGLTIASSLKVNASAAEANTAALNFKSYPFTLGVASGDPLPDGVVLWTRLAPDPINGGGMPNYDVPVRWEIASDANFSSIVQQGVEFARAALGHSVHVEVSGLQPSHEYYYRFKVGPEISPVGRTKTLPLFGTDVAQLAFAFASCQHYEAGYYTAYRHMSKDNLDLVFHLGDYIYESGPGSNKIRYHNSPEIMTLNDYRNRHALYKSDTDLQAAHAAFPWVVVNDDHEVENNFAGFIPEKDQPVEPFIARRAAAYQAYYEHMPLRRSSFPNGPSIQLYRRFQYGNLAQFHVLDTRQYRDDQANGDGNKPHSPESLDPKRTLMGAEQESWLLEGLASSQARWNVLAQQVFFCKRDSKSGPDESFSMDAWDGYPANRNRILEFAVNKGISNLVVLTGDVHANWASDIKADFYDPSSPTLGVEFIGTSISSGGGGSDITNGGKTALAENPHIKFYNNHRGYVRCTVTPDQWQTDYQVVPYVTRPEAPIFTRASFKVDRANIGLQQIYDAALPV